MEYLFPYKQEKRSRIEKATIGLSSHTTYKGHL